MTITGRRKKWWAAAAVLLAVLALAAADAGKWLVVDDPAKSDVIVVLAGETEKRPEHALELFDQGYGKRVLIDVPSFSSVYGFTSLELAKKYVESLPEAGKVGICPIVGLSTRAEAHDVERCLAGETGTKILLVTSDYHSRRALSIFRGELPQKSFTVGAARDPREFGEQWWKHREWAKTCVGEWMKAVWWNLVERWK